RPDQAVKSGSVSGRFAGVDRVRPDRRPRELLDEEVLLVREPGRREDADRLGPVSLYHPLQARGGDVERMLPARRLELAALPADERLREPVRVMDEVEGKTALHAEVALVREVLRLRRDLDDVLRLGIEVEVDLAADAAERAGRPHLLERALGLPRPL